MKQFGNITECGGSSNIKYCNIDGIEVCNVLF